MKTLLLQTLYKNILSVGKHLMLNQIQLYLTRQWKKLFNKYPALYKVMDYLFTNLDRFNYYLYLAVFKLHVKLENRYPVIYSILLYLHSEYLAILNGSLSKNMGYLISFYILYDINNTNLTLFTLLLLNTFLKEYLTKNTWIEANYPILYKMLLDITSLVNSCLIFYFLDCILIKIIMPFLLKVWNFVLKMTGESGKNTNNSGSGNNHPEGSPNPDGNDGSVNTTDFSKSKKRKRWVPMSELSPEDQEKRRASNRKKDDAKKLKKARELEKFEDLSENEKKAFNEKIKNTKIKNAERSAKWKNKTNYKSPYNKDDKKIYYEENKEYILSKRAEHREAHKELHSDYQKKYREVNDQRIKETASVYSEIHREELKIKAKDNYWNNRNDRVEQKKEYNDKNREIINEKQRIKYAEDNNLWDKKDHWKSFKNRSNIKFVDPNAEEAGNQVLSEEMLEDKSLDKGKSKVDKRIYSLSDSEYLSESSEDSTFQDDLYKAMEESREQARKNSSNKKGESSKRSK